MPRPFDISTPKDKMDLDTEGKGQATFTVSNSSGATARGRARVVPGDPVQARWYTIDGDLERSLRADQTTQYTVRAAVPKDTLKGEYTLRLDMVALDNTDEVAVEGPRVVIPCKGPPGPTPVNGFPKWLIPVIAAAVLLLVGGGVLAWVLLKGGKEVPDVVAMKVLYADAEARLKEAGFTAMRGDTVPKTDMPADTVVDQDPKAGAKEKEGTVVTLTVSTKDVVPVPDVGKLQFDEAKQKLQAQRLDAEFRGAVFRAGTTSGTVIDQDPKPGGEPVPAGSVVALTVAINETIVPTVKGLGLTFEAAEQKLTAAGLEAARGEAKPDRNAPADTVIDQDPLPDKKVPSGTPVTLTVTTRGTVPNIDVTKQTLSKAKEMLKAQGLNWKIGKQTAKGGTPQDVVLSQTPLPKDKPELPKNDTVTLEVSVDAVQVPALEGKQLDDAMCTQLRERGLYIKPILLVDKNVDIFGTLVLFHVYSCDKKPNAWVWRNNTELTLTLKYNPKSWTTAQAAKAAAEKQLNARLKKFNLITPPSWGYSRSKASATPATGAK